MTTTILGFLSFLLLAGSILLWSRGIKSVSVPKNRSGFVAVWLGAALLGIAAHANDVGMLGGIPAAIGAFGGGFLLLLVGISPQKVAADAIAVGGSLPHFTAPDEDGQIFDSASLRGHPVLIKFFRGHW